MDSEQRRQTNIGTHNKSDRRNDSSTTTTKRQPKGASTSSASSVATSVHHNIVIKKDILPQSKSNPSAIRIKSTAPTSTLSLKPNQMYKGTMNLTSTAVTKSTESVKSTTNSSNSNPIKPIRLLVEDHIIEDDEEILDGLYTLYLQKRLLAQMAYHKMKYHESKQTNTLAMLFVHHAVDKRKFEARLRSFRRMEKEKAQIDKIGGIENELDSLLEKILLHDESQEIINHFENNLSAVSDVLPIIDHSTNSKGISPSFEEKQVEFEDLNFKPMSESYKQIKEISSIPNGPLKIAEELHQSLEFLQTIRNTSKSEVKDLNDKILQLASLSISKSLFDSNENDTMHIT